jgi:hypothetical protein
LPLSLLLRLEALRATLVYTLIFPPPHYRNCEGKGEKGIAISATVAGLIPTERK